MEDPVDECYRSINHAQRMMRKMEHYLCKKQLCDVILVVGAKKIPAHRIVLSAASDYFAAMFTNDVKEATQEEIKMKDVDPESLAALIQYMYTGEIILIQYMYTGEIILIQYMYTGEMILIQYMYTGEIILIQYMYTGEIIPRLIPHTVHVYR